MKKFNKCSIMSLLIATLVLGFPGHALAATKVDLGAAEDFVILAGTAVTNVPTSVITGDVGLSPAAGSNYTGLTAAQVTGTIYAVDASGPAGSVNNPALLTSAKNDLTAAYLNAAGQTPVSTVPTELGGTTKNAGIYDSAAGDFQITGTLTLDGQGDPNAVFIFKMASTLTTATSSTVSLVNGAQACNIFWQVGSSTGVLGANSIFKGNLLALTSLNLNSGANVEGRVLARNGAVTLASNTITRPICSTTTAGTSTGTTTPGLPNTGVGTTGTDIAWGIIIPAIILIGVLPISFYLARKRPAAQQKY